MRLLKDFIADKAEAIKNCNFDKIFELLKEKREIEDSLGIVRSKLRKVTYTYSEDGTELLHISVNNALNLKDIFEDYIVPNEL